MAESSTPWLSRRVGQTNTDPNMADQEHGIDIVPYDPSWPVAFETEAGRLRSALRGLALRIEHHGSTAIPGLSAKPIIDIQVSVAALQPAATYGDGLQALGYVHVVERGGHEEQRTLAFRDYLRDHPDTARAYEDMKRALAARFTGNDPESREAYAHSKTDFVERVLILAIGSGYPKAFE